MFGISKHSHRDVFGFLGRRPVGLQLVDVLCDSFASGLSLAAEWTRVEPRVQFVPARDSRSLLVAVEARTPVAVVLSMGAEDVRELVSELRRAHPLQSIIVLTDGIAHRRGSSPLSLLAVDREDRDGALRTIRRLLRPSVSSMQRLTVSTIVRRITLEGRSCVVNVRAGDVHGRIFFRAGALVHAECGDATPLVAARLLIALRDCEASFDSLPDACVRTIDLPVDYVLLEADEQHERPRASSQKRAAQFESSSGEYRVTQFDEHAASRLIDGVLASSGAIAAAIVDLDRVVIVAQRSVDDSRLASAAAIASIVAPVTATASRESADVALEVVVRRQRCFEVAHFFARDRQRLLWASFDPTHTTIAIACARLAHLSGSTVGAHAVR